MLDSATIILRATARQAAKIITDLINEEQAANRYFHQPEYKLAFYKALAEHSFAAVPELKEHFTPSVQGVSLEPMTDAELTEFRRAEIPVGKYQGQSVDEVEPEYFSYFTKHVGFSIKCLRYLKHPDIQRQVETQIDPEDYM